MNGLSPELLSLVVARAPTPILVLDASGRVLLANEAAERELSPPALERGRTLSELGWLLRSPDGAEVVWEKSALRGSLLDGETVHGLEVDIGSSSGARRVVFDGAPVSDQVIVLTLAGSRHGARDHLLHRAYRLLRQLIDAAPVGIALARGEELVVEHANPAFRAIAPDTPVIGRRFAEFAAEMPAMVQRLREVLRTGRPLHVEDLPLRVQRRPGGPLEEAWFSAAVARVRCDDAPPALVGIVLETTLQVETRHRLQDLLRTFQRRTAKLEFVFDNMAEAVVSFDPLGRATLLNRAARQIFGVEDHSEFNDLMPRFCEEFDSRRPDGTQLTFTESALGRTLAGESVALADELVRNRHTGQVAHLRINSARVPDEEGVSVASLVVARDISDVVEFERLKDQFLRQAAHELKTPVAIVKGYALSLLRTGGALPSTQRRMLESIDRGANRIDAIVQNLLDLAQLDARRLPLATEPVNLLEVLQHAVDEASVLNPTRPVLLEALQPAVVSCDRERVLQVLHILLDNATRYSPAESEVVVRLEIADSSATVAVVDRGIGIPQERQARVFERFFRAHGDTPYDLGGIGLGLYLARRIIEAMGGRMWFESVPEKGSTFSFALPLASFDEQR